MTFSDVTLKMPREVELQNEIDLLRKEINFLEQELDQQDKKIESLTQSSTAPATPATPVAMANAGVVKLSPQEVGELVLLRSTVKELNDKVGVISKELREADTKNRHLTELLEGADNLAVSSQVSLNTISALVKRILDPYHQ